MKTVVKPIEMICHIESDGSIHPIRCRLETDEGKISFKVMQVRTVTMTKIAGNKVACFSCYIQSNNLIKECELRYELDTCRWILFKI